tara:strand:- start:165 stop:299 length:135 start_codon:yes stop_codon:yes gene_type:complete
MVVPVIVALVAVVVEPELLELTPLQVPLLATVATGFLTRLPARL